MLFLVISSGRNGSLVGLFVFNEPHLVSSFYIVPRRNKLALSSGICRLENVQSCLTSALPALSKENEGGGSGGTVFSLCPPPHWDHKLSLAEISDQCHS